VGLGMVTVGCMQSIVLLVGGVVFSRGHLEGARISRKKAFFCNQL